MGSEMCIRDSHGALRLSATTFHAEVEQATGEISALLRQQNNTSTPSRPIQHAMERAQKRRS